MTAKHESFNQKTGLDTPIFSLFTLNWETALYIILLLLAVATRFYDLGARVMSHDESLHTLYSWNLYAGKGYLHDPLMHGPFLFHINALMYFLFGDNDFTARISVALFGVALVILPYWFRPWLGRLGALAASFMILISPGLLYYSRYIRNEAYINVWTVLMTLAFFQYMRTRAARWLIIGAAAISFMLSTKEVAFIHGFIGFTFIAMMWLWESAPKATRRTVNYALWAAVGMMIAAVTFMSIRADTLTIAAVEGETGGFNPWDYIDVMLMIIQLLIGLLIIQRGVDRTRRPVTQTLLSLPGRLPDLGKAVVIAIIIFVLLYTTFFSNLAGLGTGTVGALTYWLNQQEVQRGGQPWYYYLFLVPLYEFLPFFVGVIGGLVYLLRKKILPASPADSEADNGEYHPSDGGTFAVYCIYWALTSFAIYSWAGEKMPWLTVHMTLPLIFLAAHVLQTAFNKFNWAENKRQGGFIFAGLLTLIIPALLSTVTVQPFRSQSAQAINETLQFIAGLLLLALIGWGVWRYGRQLGRQLAWRTALITLLTILTLLTIRFTWLLSYVNYDYVNEMLVYAHASPDVKLALEQIDNISRRTVGDKMIKVAYDNDSTWPLEWYMREYPNRAYYGETPTREALDAPVVIVGSANESKVKPFLGENYTRTRYRLVWWPIEDYKDQTPQRLWETYVSAPSPADPLTDTAEAQTARRQTVRDNWRKLFKIIFYRDYEDYDLNEWPFVHRFFVYVRNDVATEIWDSQSGPVTLTQMTLTDPYDGKRVEANALQVWGSNGNGDGQFVNPRNLAAAPNGQIYVADSGNHRIQVFDKDGNFLFKWGSEGAGPGQFSEPWGIAVAADGTVHVADTWNHRIQTFTAQGEFVRAFGTFVNVQHDAQAEPGKFWGPRGIAVGPAGNLFVTDTGNKRVQKFTADGQFLQTWGGGGIVPGSFEEPVGIDIDAQSNIYVADTWNHRIQKFDALFNPLAQWSVDGWETESVVNKPFLTTSPDGQIFISDPEGYRIIGYNGSGDVAVTWGQYGQDLASMALPLGLDFSSDGYLLIADSDNNRVMKFAVPAALQGE
jgi:uncharacterized protein (TIGR03663 family)